MVSNRVFSDARPPREAAAEAIPPGRFIAPPTRSLAASRRALAAALLLAACAAPPPPESLLESSRAEEGRFLLYDSPPAILAGGVEAAAPERVAARVEARAAALSRASRSVEAAMLPWLRASPAGARFLAAEPARALARGEPEGFCPAVGLAAGAPSPDAAAERALGACVAQLAAQGAPPDCACRLLVLNDALLAPRERFAYAPGVSARFLGLPALGAAPLVAEERAEGETRIVTLRGPVGVLGALRIGPEGAATLRLASGEVLTGRSQPVGWRRGRLAEVVRFEAGETGEPTLLLGFEPEEIAVLGAR